MTADAVLITLDSIPATYDHSDEVPSATAASGWRSIRPGYYGTPGTTNIEIPVRQAEAAEEKLILSTAGIIVTITRQTGKAFDIVDNDGISDGDPILVFSQQGKSPAFGKRSLDPFFDQSANGFIFNFYDSETYDPESVTNDPVEITGFSLLAGDYGFDLDQMSLQAYHGPNLTGGAVADGNGIALGGALHGGTLPGTGNTLQWTQLRLRVSSAGGFQSVRFTSSGGLVNGVSGFSVYVDRIAFVRGNDVLPPDSELDDPTNTGDIAVLFPEPSSLILVGASAAVMLVRRRVG